MVHYRTSLKTHHLFNRKHQELTPQEPLKRLPQNPCLASPTVLNDIFLPVLFKSSRWKTHLNQNQNLKFNSVLPSPMKAHSRWYSPWWQEATHSALSSEQIVLVIFQEPAFNNIMFSEKNQTQREHALLINLCKVQEQTKLIYDDRNQNCSYSERVWLW